jgi:hypothetical protein
MNVFLLHVHRPEADRLLSFIHAASGASLPKRAYEDEEYAKKLYVIRWLDGVERNGGSAEQDAPIPLGARVLQPASAVRLSLDAHRRLRAWRLSGVNVLRESAEALNGAQTQLMRRLVVPVFQLEALGVFSSGGASGPISRQPLREGLTEWTMEQGVRSIAIRRAEREAVKAVYALGLDYGTVTIVSDSGGVAAVEGIDPYPPKDRVLIERFAGAIARFQEGLAKELSRAAPVMLGMDPEFVLRRSGPGGKIVMASKFLERKGAVGCDGVRFGDRLLYALAELRPMPAAEPAELFRNLYATMKLASERISDGSLEWLAGGMPAKGLPLGGHIHVSGVFLHADLLRVMDNYMALPLVLIEDATTKNRRPRYGALGDFRRQFHGGFEYRTLPSWIVSPTLAMGVLSLAKLVCEHAHELRQRPLERSDMQAAYYAGDKNAIKPAALKLWSDLEKTAGYAKYSRYLNKLKRMLERSEPWNEQQDVRKSWKLPPYGV